MDISFSCSEDYVVTSTLPEEYNTKIRADFSTALKDNLKSLADEREKLLVKVKQSKKIFKIVLVCYLVLDLCFSVYSAIFKVLVFTGTDMGIFSTIFNGLITFLMIILFGYFIIAIPYSYQSWFETRFQEIYRSIVIPLVLYCFGEFSYSLNSSAKTISVDLMKRSLLFDKIDHLEMLDCIEGRFRGVDFSVCSLNNYRLVSVRKSCYVSRESYYNGIYCVMRSNHLFEGKSVIYLNNNDININSAPPNDSTLKRVFLNNSFDPLICCFSNNESEIRSIMTPSFLQNLQLFSMAYKNRLIKISMFDENVIITIQREIISGISVNLFQIPSIYKDVYSVEEFLGFASQIYSLFNIRNLFDFL